MRSPLRGDRGAARAPWSFFRAPFVCIFFSPRAPWSSRGRRSPREGGDSARELAAVEPGPVRFAHVHDDARQCAPKFKRLEAWHSGHDDVADLVERRDPAARWVPRTGRSPRRGSELCEIFPGTGRHGTVQVTAASRSSFDAPRAASDKAGNGASVGSRSGSESRAWPQRGQLNAPGALEL